MKCKYCGKSAGFLSSIHKECKEAHDNSVAELRKLVSKSLQDSPNYMEVCDNAARTMSIGYVKPYEFNDILFTEVMSATLRSQQPYKLLAFISTIPSPLLDRFKLSAAFKRFRDEAVRSILDEIFISTDIDFDTFYQIREVAESVGFTEINEQVIKEIGNRVEACLEDGIIEAEEEESIKRIIERTEIPIEELSKSSSYEHYIQALVLRDIQEGKTPNRIAFGSLPVLLAKKEYPLWAYTNVKGYERKTGKEYVGGSKGVSIRICKGVYYRTGGTKGHSVDYQYTQPLGTGSLIITNIALYFLNQTSTVKVLIPKIVSIEPFTDGIGIVKDGARPRPLYFEGFDSWFLMNLLPLLTE